MKNKKVLEKEIEVPEIAPAPDAQASLSELQPESPINLVETLREALNAPLAEDDDKITLVPAHKTTLSFKRDESGLLPNINYQYNEDGSINWRAMVDSKYLYVNKEAFTRRNEPIPTSVEGLKDSELIISLQGLKCLAALRGFKSVTYRPVTAGTEYSGVICRIDWIGNFETNMEVVAFEDGAGASLMNTSEMIQTYLLETACNRAFARAIRNFLRIGIVSKEELPPAEKPKAATNKISPSSLLSDLMKEKSKTFADVKEKLIKEGKSVWSKYNDWKDIPPDEAFQLIERFKNLR